jgi:hypothetical protein
MRVLLGTTGSSATTAGATGLSISGIDREHGGRRAAAWRLLAWNLRQPRGSELLSSLKVRK